jgi:flagellar hook assembly protein FlgD
LALGQRRISFSTKSLDSHLEVTTAVEQQDATGLAERPVLEQNFANPFNSGTVIHFALPQSETINLSVYNLAGQKVASLVSGTQPAGPGDAHWDGRDDEGRALASGVYLYRLQVGSVVETRKLALVR